MTLAHERLLSLIEFAQQSSALRGNPVSEIGKHNFHEYEHNLLGLSGIRFNDVEEDCWLIVERLHELKPPTAKDSLLSFWLDVSNNPSAEPTLKKSITLSEQKEFGKDNILLLKDFNQQDELEGQLRSYIETEWMPWSIEEKKRRRSIHLYGRLYMLKQQLEGSITDAPLELVWGLGMAVWNMNGTKVTYPLITQLVEISVNDQTMSIEIRPRDVEPRLELEIYSSVDNPGTANLEKSHKELQSKATQTFSPFDSGTYDAILRVATACLDSKGTYWPTQTTADNRQLPPASEELKITDTWALMARPRSQNLFVQDLERFRKAIVEDKVIDIPEVLKAVLTEPKDYNTDVELPNFRGISMVYGNGSGSSASGKTADLYFPKAFNDEQVRIVQLLACYDGVIVQGPPGTGKTHTISNVICHYLALGKRVLVTSMKDPALNELRNKLPEDIRSLAISLLANDRQGTKQFEHAITKIAAEIQNIDRLVYNKEIARLDYQIDTLHANMARIDRQFEEWAKKNLSLIMLDGEEIHPVDAANEVVKFQDQFLWFDDDLTLADRPSITNIEIGILRKARRQVTKDMHYFGAKLPEIASFPDLSELVRIHQDLSQHRTLGIEIETGKLPPLVDSKKETILQVYEAAQKIKSLVILSEKISNGDVIGVDKAKGLIDKSSSNLSTQLVIFDNLGQELADAVNERNEYIDRPIEIEPDFYLDEDMVRAIKNKAEGKPAFGISGLFGKGATKKKLEEIRILTWPPQSAEDWQYVHRFCGHQNKNRELITRWNSIATELLVDKFDSADPSHIQKANELYVLHVDIRKHSELEIEVINHSRELLPAWKLCHEIKTNTERLCELQGYFNSHTLRYRLAIGLLEKDKFQAALLKYDGEVIKDLQRFYSEVLGNPKFTDAEMQATWSALLKEVKRIHDLQGAFLNIATITDQIVKSGAPKWAAKLKTVHAAETDDSLLPSDWEKAWRVRSLSNYLAAIDSRMEIKKLAVEREHEEGLLKKSYESIVAKKTWLKLSEKATPSIRSALMAFQTAISKIGKGTGKRAVRYRQDARDAASKANSAIPCWIMPHWRVSSHYRQNWDALIWSSLMKLRNPIWPVYLPYYEPKRY